MRRPRSRWTGSVAVFLLGTGLFACGVGETGESFQIEETTIRDIQTAVLGGDNEPA